MLTVLLKLKNNLDSVGLFTIKIRGKYVLPLVIKFKTAT